MIIAAQLNQKNPEYFSINYFDESLLNTCTPCDWWSSQYPLQKIQPSKIDYAKKLMILPSSSADIERHFSALGRILNERRARLGVDKASKLCTIYKSLAGDYAPSDDGVDWIDK